MPIRARQCASSRCCCTRSETQQTCIAQLQQSLSAHHHFQPCSIPQTLSITLPLHKLLYFSHAWSIFCAFSCRHTNASSGETFCWVFLSPSWSLLPLINYAQMSFIGSLSMPINNYVPLAGAVKLIWRQWKAMEMLSLKSWFITYCTVHAHLIAQGQALLSRIYRRPQSVEFTMSSRQEIWHY